MVKIRLLYPFTYHHLELPAGEILEVSRERANRLVSLGAAEYAEPQHAIVEPQEMRIVDVPRRRGRPKKPDVLA